MPKLSSTKRAKTCPPDTPRGPAYLRVSRIIGGPNTYIFGSVEKDESTYKVPEGYVPIVQYTGVKTNVLRHTFSESGFLVQFKEVPEWEFTWSKSQKNEFFSKLLPYQKANHFPKTYELGRKDNLTTNMQRMKALYGEEFDFYPTTYFYPKELDKCTKLLYDSKIRRNRIREERRELDKDYGCGREEKKGIVIIKPIASSRGRGIKLATELPDPSESRGLIVQEYIDNPLLLDGYKFDLRIYVLLTSINPLRVLVYRDGLVRKATKKYVPFEECSLRDIQYTHLTNFSLNCNSTDFIAPTDEDDEGASKMKISHMLEHFKKTGHEIPMTQEEFWTKVDSLVIKTISSAYPYIKKSYVESLGPNLRTNACFEMFGFDIMIDSDFDFHLIEVNTSPATATGSVLDKRLKYPLIECLMNIVGIEARENFKPPEDVKVAQVPPPHGIDPITAAENERIKSMGGLWELVYPSEKYNDLSKYFD